MSGTELRLGIDLGGTKTEIIALADDGTPLLRERVATPQGDDYAAMLQMLKRLVVDVERRLGARGSIGIGTPGSISRASGRLRGSNSVCLNGQPVQRDLEALLERPVRISNDANCFALSEAADGAGEGAAVVFGAILGTGCGAGIVAHGHVLDGPNAIAGEWGHNPLPWPAAEELPGPPCFCGQRGCIETWVSGTGFERDHVQHGGAALRAAAIMDAFRGGSQDARASFERYVERLARALSHVINILDPDVIVLGGGMSNVAELYDAVPARWGAWVFSDRVDTRLVPNRHGDSSGVRGAAWLGASRSATIARTACDS